MSLTTHDIVAAGLEILDNYGLEDLSMRRLAQLLDVKASALYWHVANKQTLLAAMADEILGEEEQLTPTDDGGSWPENCWGGRMRCARNSLRIGTVPSWSHRPCRSGW